MASYNFKVVLLGQGCVGKTSLVLRYVSNVFNDSHQSTLQASFLQKQLYLEQDLIRLNIWDTAGQEKFHALGPIYYREANGAIIVYDVTCPESLKKVRDWVKELNKMLGAENIRLAIIGNKADLLQGSITNGANHSPMPYARHHHNPLGNRLHQQQQQQLAASNELIAEAIQFTNELSNARHHLTSAKLNQGIGELFVSLSKRMVEQSKRRLAERDSKTLVHHTRLLKTAVAIDTADEPQSYNAMDRIRVIEATMSAPSPNCSQCWK